MDEATRADYTNKMDFSETSYLNVAYEVIRHFATHSLDRAYYQPMLLFIASKVRNMQDPVSSVNLSDFFDHFFDTENFTALDNGISANFSGDKYSALHLMNLITL